MKKWILWILIITLLLCFNVNALTFYSSSTNTTVAGTPIEHRLRWQDDNGLSMYIFSFDNCVGDFTNITEGSLISNDDWSNVTVPITNIVGCTVRWKVYANNSNNVWNISDTYSYVTTSPVPQIQIKKDKSDYKPGDRISINVTSDDVINDANFIVIRPDGSFETPNPVSMTYVDPNERSRNYSLGVDGPEGIYTVKVSADVGGYFVEKSITFSVSAWKTFLIMKMYVFNVTETMNITFNVYDSYSDDLDFNVIANLIKPNGSLIEIYRSTSKGYSQNEISYTFPLDFPNGTSRIGIVVNDSYGRRRDFSLDIFVYLITNISTIAEQNVPFLSVEPYIWSEITTIGKSFQKTFELENSGKLKISNINVEIPEVLSKIVKILSKPDYISPNSKSNLVLEFNTADIEPKNYSDFVQINSSRGNPQIYVSIEVVKNISLEVENYFNQLKSLEEDIKVLEKSGKDVKNVSSLLQNTRQTFDEASNSYKSEDLPLAKAKMESALSSLSELNNSIDSMKTVEKVLSNKANDSITIILIFATAAIASIVGIVIIKHFHKGGKKGETKVMEVYSKEDL